MLRAFVVDNDEKVASSKKHTQFKTRVQNHTLFETKMAKIDTLFLTKTAKNPYPLRLHILIIPITPRPGVVRGEEEVRTLSK